jgi:hypothetical protein
VANAIGKMIDAADLTSATIQKLLLACLVCEMKQANVKTIREVFPHEQCNVEVSLNHDSSAASAPFNRPTFAPPKKPH